jgi:Spy/CpxP family protein refolding chaperone
LPDRSSVWRAALVVLLAFVAGIAIGIVGDRAYLFFHERIIPRGGIEFMGRHLLKRIDRRLDLTDAQEAQVKAIIDRHTKRMLDELTSVHKNMHAEFNATNAEIETVLTPEQREEFRKMQRRWHR